jgi:hypothetical protein
MSGNQLRQHAEVLQDCLLALIYEKGWSIYTSFEKAVQTHFKHLEKLIKNYK